jgi:hypothetical protein
MTKAYVSDKNRKYVSGTLLPEAYEKLAERAFRNNRSIRREFTDIIEKTVLRQGEQRHPAQEVPLS